MKMKTLVISMALMCLLSTTSYSSPEAGDVPDDNRKGPTVEWDQFDATAPAVADKIAKDYVDKHHWCGQQQKMEKGSVYIVYKRDAAGNCQAVMVTP